MTTELTGLKLRRRYWEARGWRSVDLVSKTVWRGTLGGEAYDHASPGCYIEAIELPPVERDSGLAMEELLKFCANGHAAYELFNGGGTNEPHLCTLTVRMPKGARRPYERVGGEGSTPAEAITRAIIAACASTSQPPPANSGDSTSFPART